MKIGKKKGQNSGFELQPRNSIGKSKMKVQCVYNQGLTEKLHHKNSEMRKQ